MKKVITYGTFDLFHEGHYNLLKRAKALGDYLIVGVTTDNFDLERGKINTCDNIIDRIEAVRQTGLVDKIIIEEYRGQKIDDIRKYGVDIFAIGSDWTGHFDYLKEFCEVVYLPRTEGVSSTQLRASRPSVKIGVIGTGSIAGRFVDEASFVSGAEIVSAFNPDSAECKRFAYEKGITFAASSENELLSHCDAVYVASPHGTHYGYSKLALESGKHVLCETPFTLSRKEADELISLAKKKGLCLMVALKTAYCPAFGHLITLLQSGEIGDIVEVNASVTTLTDENSPKLDASALGGSMNENACFPMLPIFKLLGTDFRDVCFYSKERGGTDIFTKAIFRYDTAVASFQVGLGVKTEGNLVVSGTKGYAYVPAPWWKTDYFEIRYEDQNKNKKYFYPYAGEGLRYEIKDFVGAILSSENVWQKITDKENLAMARVQEDFLAGKNVNKI
ncbi:MAG: Gfo/Idh/MocA family oxidoreductase [Bacteroidales bacterium]|nr:Gfo/Idh/MocA family oxidoreductase [Bacteroidales bacterium]